MNFINRSTVPFLAIAAGLLILLVNAVLSLGDPGLDAAELENPNGRVRISIFDPSSQTSLARLSLPGDDGIELSVSKADDHLRVIVLNSPEDSEFRRGQEFRLVYIGTRLFQCDGGCGRIGLLQS